MGLFSKKENDKEKAPAPPGPPKPTQGNSGGSPLPPPPGGNQMPPSPQSSQSKGQTSPTQSTNSSYGSMPQPPSPMGGLNDIKNQISTPNATPQAPSNRNAPMQNQEESSNDELESLFDFSELDEQLQNSSSQTSQNTQLTTNQNQEEELPQQREHSDEELTFLKTQDEPQSKHRNHSIYITTSQFKALLEIVEEVKLKAKDSSERHLRLLDIKSEEDIEFENLKKDFAFIEDKLYEVDNLIFER